MATEAEANIDIGCYERCGRTWSFEGISNMKLKGGMIGCAQNFTKEQRFSDTILKLCTSIRDSPAREALNNRSKDPGDSTSSIRCREYYRQRTFWKRRLAQVGFFYSTILRFYVSIHGFTWSSIMIQISHRLAARQLPLPVMLSSSIAQQDHLDERSGPQRTSPKVPDWQQWRAGWPSCVYDNV